MKAICKKTNIYFETRKTRKTGKTQKSDEMMCPVCYSTHGVRGYEISIKKYKETVWKVFSEYIRKRDCIKTTGDIKTGICYTCGQVFPYKKLQAGHLVDGRRPAVLFDDEIVKAQCFKCNVINSGCQGIFTLKIIDELKDPYGLDIAVEILKNYFKKGYKKHDFTLKELNDIYWKFINKLDELER